MDRSIDHFNRRIFILDPLLLLVFIQLVSQYADARTDFCFDQLGINLPARKPGITGHLLTVPMVLQVFP